MTQQYKVTGMTCGHCVRRVQDTLAQIEGVKTVIVTLDPPLATINTPQPVAASAINAALEEVGDYTVSIKD